MVKCRYCKKEIERETSYADTTKRGFYFCSEDHYKRYMEDKKPKIKCCHCGNIIEENPIKVANKTVCSNCYPQYIQIEDVQRDIFIDYIWKLYPKEKKSNSLYFSLVQQAEHFHNSYKMKYTGMYVSAQYWIEILEKKWNDQYGLGQFLPRAYGECQDLHQRKADRRNLLAQHQPSYTNTIVSTFNQQRKPLKQF